MSVFVFSLNFGGYISKKHMIKNFNSAKCWSPIFIFGLIWIIFSVIYIFHDLWDKGIKLIYEQGVTRAQTEIITRIIDQTSASCDSINLFIGTPEDKKTEVNLINVACLKAVSNIDTETAQRTLKE